MSRYTEGARVKWTAGRSPYPVYGTIVDATPDPRHSETVTVAWDGIGTYVEDGIHLTVVDESPAPQ